MVIPYCLRNLLNDLSWGVLVVVVVRGVGGCYKQLNDLITSYGSSEVIAAYGENHSGKLSDFILQRLVVGGGKFC